MYKNLDADLLRHHDCGVPVRNEGLLPTVENVFNTLIDPLDVLNLNDVTPLPMPLTQPRFCVKDPTQTVSVLGNLHVVEVAALTGVVVAMTTTASKNAVRNNRSNIKTTRS